MKKTSPKLPRPYKCPICDKAFYRLEHQTRHIRTHTGEKPHVCTFPGCTKRFSRSDELTRHSRIHSNPNSRRNQRKEVDSPPAATTNQPAVDAKPGMPHTSPPAANQVMFSAPGSPMPVPQQVQDQLKMPGPGFNRTSSSNSISVGLLSRWNQQQAQQAQHSSHSSHSSHNPGQYDIHALATTATQMLEQERRGHGHGPGAPSNGSGAAHPHHSHFNRQRSTPALASYFHHHAHMGPYDRSRLDPLTPLHTSAANTVPNSPAVSRPASPSPESTPLATPGHSPTFGPQEGVQLPAIRSLPLSRFGAPALHPMEPTAQPFSGIRTTLDLPAFSMAGPAAQPAQNTALSRPTSPPRGAGGTTGSHSRVSVSDLVNPVKIEN